MDQKTQFIADYLRQTLTMSELCELYGISRKTGYKILDRYLRHGPAGLEEQSRRPSNNPNQTPEHIVQALIALRQRHPSWGAKKLLPLLEKRHPSWQLPARTTVCDILSREGLVRKKRTRRAIGHPGKPATQILAPNDVWSADFKGHFKTGDGLYCYPLTIADGFSRYLLSCQGLYSTCVADAKPVFTRVFKEYGLPKRIRTDNGVPFATTTLARLSALSAWWVRLGILPELIEPGKPQQNGRHERMHRTLKAETTRPPAHNCCGQQRKFDRFRHEFNAERPHEALDMQTPAQYYEPSAREMPNKIPPLEYPDRFEVRYVATNGGIRWNHHWLNVSIVCAGEYVGLEEIDDGVWNVFFGPLKLGRLLERHMKIEDAWGRLNRKNLTADD
jgi:transposase InsO family protein